LTTLVREALTTARTGRCGSAYLDLPTDVLIADLGEAPTASAPYIATSGADAGAVDEAVRLLAGAERPCVLVGGGAFWGGAGDALRDFAEASGIPVTTTSHSRGLLPDNHPTCLGGLLHGGVGVAFADVVLIVGSRFNGNLLFGKDPLWRADHTVIQIDADPTGFALNRTPALGLLGDCAVVLRQLTAAWKGEPPTAWCEEAKGYSEASFAHWVEETEADASGVHPGWAARELCAFAEEQGGGDQTVVVDGGDALGWALAFVRAEQAGSFLFTSDALGTLGVGVPYAVAAPLARTQGPTFAFIGDGAFGLSAMEIETAARIGSAPVIVVSNNRSWGDVRYEESEWFGSTVGTDIGGGVRYDQLAVALGGHGERVERPEELRPALERSLASGVVSVIDVLTDPDCPNEVLRNMGALALQ
ncbi:MAG: thiamine pyrophosphate-binding protein, partial [Acidimicrobiia bacterium]|nr:thiamine pyrophosphate-binding protein [Acidimicrobiia bacterium]